MLSVWSRTQLGYSPDGTACATRRTEESRAPEKVSGIVLPPPTLHEWIGMVIRIVPSRNIVENYVYIGMVEIDKRKATSLVITHMFLATWPHHCPQNKGAFQGDLNHIPYLCSQDLPPYIFSLSIPLFLKKTIGSLAIGKGPKYWMMPLLKFTHHNLIIYNKHNSHSETSRNYTSLPLVT